MPDWADLLSMLNSAWAGVTTFALGVWTEFNAYSPATKAGWVIGVVVPVFGGGVWATRRVFRKPAPGPKALAAADFSKLPRAQKGVLSILVFDLEGDDANAHWTDGVERSVREAFAGHAEVQRAGGFFVRLAKRGELDARLAAGRKLVARALATSGYDGALWGNVVTLKDLANLVVQTKGAPADQQTGQQTLKLDDRLGVAPEALKDIGPLIAARFAADCALAYEGGRYVADVLAPTIERLRTLLQASPAWLAGDAKGRAWHDFATALATLGEQNGQNAPLEAAIAAYTQALKEFTRERVPLQWAMTQNNLGNALAALGRRETGTQSLEAAIAAYSQALKEFTRERVPLQWAATQNNLGAAHEALADKGVEARANLAQAVRLLEAALPVFREASPFNAETAERNLARIRAKLAALGEG